MSAQQSPTLINFGSNTILALVFSVIRMTYIRFATLIPGSTRIRLYETDVYCKLGWNHADRIHTAKSGNPTDDPVLLLVIAGLL
jgi:hypothetical protein